VRRCEFCNDGCHECFGTTLQVTSELPIGDGFMVVHGNAPLSEQSHSALLNVGEAAFALLDANKTTRS
jgi:hypothetical protein